MQTLSHQIECFPEWTFCGKPIAMSTVIRTRASKCRSSIETNACAMWIVCTFPDVYIEPLNCDHEVLSKQT